MAFQKSKQYLHFKNQYNKYIIRGQNNTKVVEILWGEWNLAKRGKSDMTDNCQQQYLFAFNSKNDVTLRCVIEEMSYHIIKMILQHIYG